MKKIAIPTRGTVLDNHFGHCEKFTIFSLDDNNQIVNKEDFASPESCGCKTNLASDLFEYGVSVLLAGGIGQGAVNKLKTAGIDVFSGYSGDVEQVLTSWCNGNTGDASLCSSHDHNCSH